MDLNQIKKELYKQKPKAAFASISKDGIVYTCELSTGEKTSKYFRFLIPLSDIGDARFEPIMQAQLLIRYIDSILTN